MTTAKHEAMKATVRAAMKGGTIRNLAGRINALAKQAPADDAFFRFIDNQPAAAWPVDKMKNYLSEVAAIISEARTNGPQYILSVTGGNQDDRELQRIEQLAGIIMTLVRTAQKHINGGQAYSGPPDRSPLLAAMKRLGNIGWELEKLASVFNTVVSRSLPITGGGSRRKPL